MSEQSWIEKYQPQTTNQLLGNAVAIKTIKDWLEKWPKSITRNRRALLLHGPTGVGKTIAVHVIAKDLGFEVSELNASLKRSKKAITELLRTSTTTGSLIGHRGRVLFVDELAGLSGKSDRGATSALKEYISKSRVPMILATLDITNQKIRTLLKICQLVEFHLIPEEIIAKQLKLICKKEKIRYEEEALNTLVAAAKGDLRAAINDLQGVAQTGEAVTTETIQRILKWRDQKIDINEALDRIFYAETWNQSIKSANQVDIYPDELLRWVSTNIPLVYQDIEQIVKAFEWLSRASIFSSRIIKTQNWKLLPYSKELMCIPGTITEGAPSSKHPKYRFPEWIRQMGFSRNLRQKRNQIGAILAPIVHMSSRRAYQEYMPLLRILLRNSQTREGTIRNLDLSEDTVNFILHSMKR